jgi:excisionase family DNA binding protein
MSTSDQAGAARDKSRPRVASAVPAKGTRVDDATRSAGARAPRKPTAEQARRDVLAEVRFLTVAEVAAVMRVSKMTVYRMVHAAELPAVRVGRSFRVPEKAVDDYLRGAFIEAG